MFFRGVAGLLLFFPGTAFASSSETPSLTSYMMKVGLGLGLLAILGYAAVFFSGRRVPLQAKGSLSVLASLPLGRDVLFVVRCGPEVIALISGSSGPRVIGRWSYEEWLASWNDAPSS